MRRTADYDNLLRMQAVKYLQYTFFQRCAAHYAVVNYNKVVLVRLQRLVSNIIDMGCQVVARSSFRDECAQLDVLPCDLLAPYILMQQMLQLFIRRLVVHIHYQVYLLLVDITLEAAKHSIKSHLGRIRDEREHGMLRIIIYGLKD